MVGVEVERMLRLAEQCLERAKSSIQQRSDPPDLPTSTSTGQLEPLQATGHPTAITTNTSELNLILSGCPLEIQTDGSS